MSAEWKVGIAGDCGLSGLVVNAGEGWRWADHGRACFDQPPPNLRPLVLIDPEDEERVERLLRLYYDVKPSSGLVDDMQAALREYASPTPPKPDEPMGLGAVVVDADGIKWVHADCASRPWLRENGIGDAWRNYADISAVEVLSAGVES